MNIGIAIKDLRKSKGISQVDLAKAAKTTQAALSQIESGRRPKIETMQKICKALDIPEPLLHLLSLEVGDLPKENRHLYNDIFPLIKNLINSLVNKKEN